METTETSNFTCQSKSFICIFFTWQVSACQLQPFSCHDLANDIYSITDKTVFSHLKELASARKGHWSTAMPCWWDPVTAKQLFMAATAHVIMAVRICEVMARPWVGVCVPIAHFYGNSWSTFPAHVLVELSCGSQPTAPTRVVWTYRLIDCFALSSAVRVFFYLVYRPGRELVYVSSLL